MEISASPDALERSLESPALPFWTKPHNTETPTEWITEGYLHSCLQSGRLKRRFYRLSKTELVCFKVTTKQDGESSVAIRSARIGLKLCLPFFDPHENKFPLGFKLLGCCEKAFHTETPEDLHHWISCLALTSLLSNLENDFTVLDEIGFGSYSPVYLAHKSSSPDRLYAVKRIPRPDSAVQCGYQRIAREIETYRKLSHPNIVKLHYVYCSPDSIDLVMDYLPEGSLDDHLFTNGALSMEELQRLTKVLIDLCRYMCENGVTHRDIKPENILLTSTNDFQLTDFGLAASATSGLTDPFGSPGFAAPELLLGKEYDYKVDIYSSGVTIVAAAVGSNPVTERTVRDLAKRNGGLTEVLPKNIEWNVLGLVESMLELNPANRPSAQKLSITPQSGNSTPKGIYPKFSQDLLARLNRPPGLCMKKGTDRDDTTTSTTASP